MWAAWGSTRGRVGKPGGSQDDGMAVMVLIVSITPLFSFLVSMHFLPRTRLGWETAWVQRSRTRAGDGDWVRLVGI
jgi:hypothetical protein